MLKHAIVMLVLLGSLAPVATAAAQTADSAVAPDRTIALWNGKDLSNWDADVPNATPTRRCPRASSCAAACW